MQDLHCQCPSKALGAKASPRRVEVECPYRRIVECTTPMNHYGNTKRAKTNKQKRSEAGLLNTMGGECARIKYLTELVAESRGPSYNQNSGPFEAL